MFSHHEIVTQAGLLQTVTTSWCAFAAIATGRPKDAALSAKVLCSAFGIFSTVVGVCSEHLALLLGVA